jgi:glycosyltransferase involved in cell wall biosynthesis
VLVGPAAEGEDERLRSLAEGLGINGAVQVVPPVSHREVLALTAAAAVAVSPIPPTELYRVASPTKVVEALALGCPVVVSPIRDQAELVHASGGGVVAPFEAEAFAAAISSLLSDPVGARSMGRSGAAYVRRHRSYERLSQTLLDAYRAMLAEVRR